MLDQGPVDPKAPRDVPVEGQDFSVCVQCGRKVKLTRLGYFEPHNATLNGGDRCPTSGVRAKHAARTEILPLPGDPKPSAVKLAQASHTNVEELEEPARGNLARTPMLELEAGTDPSSGGKPTEVPPVPDAGPGASTEISSPESATTSKLSTPPEPELSAGPFSLGTSFSPRFLQPFSPFLQPGPVVPKLRTKEAMTERGRELAARIRETFYAYTNRNSSDNRSAQKTLGPSEVGSPCDRQLAMKLLGIRPVNPQEGWAPFVGTAVHAELAKMFEWANGSGSGRYLTEMRVQIGDETVPYGTLDLLDRVLYVVFDHKLMGRWSLDKLTQDGPSETYRIQSQMYGLGAVRAGEKVKEIAIIGWPRQESSLDKLYVHVEDFDRQVAEEALARAGRIAEQVKAHEVERSTWAGLDIQRHQMMIAREFEVGDDCRWCIFHSKGDKEMKRGCPGK